MNGAESGLMPDASRDQARAILGAMRAVAEAGGEGASDADRRALAAADRFIFRDPEPLDLADLRPSIRRGSRPPSAAARSPATRSCS